MRAIPTNKPTKQKTKPFVDNGELFMQFHVNNSTNRMERIEVRWKDKKKDFPIKSGNILDAFQKLERWFSVVSK
jgi:hypothetical protein